MVLPLVARTWKGHVGLLGKADVMQKGVEDKMTFELFLVPSVSESLFIFCYSPAF
jgi:hypothetical protein